MKKCSDILIIQCSKINERTKSLLHGLYSIRPLSFRILLICGSSDRTENADSFEELEYSSSVSILSDLKKYENMHCIIADTDKDDITAEEIVREFELSDDMQKLYNRIDGSIQDCFCGMANMLDSTDNSSQELNMENAVTAFAEGRLGIRAAIKCAVACIKYRLKK